MPHTAESQFEVLELHHGWKFVSLHFREEPLQTGSIQNCWLLTEWMCPLDPVFSRTVKWRLNNPVLHHYHHQRRHAPILLKSYLHCLSRQLEIIRTQMNAYCSWCSGHEICYKNEAKPCSLIIGNANEHWENLHQLTLTLIRKAIGDPLPPAASLPQKITVSSH